ncbi:MAG: pyridoxamine 5'-phosphate oxidase family protein [Acetobacteraceae bacterium]|nr:pyridoxamine 5'-phosphate oxidase family protein [Acetobacteraceae bacterium]
MAISEEKRESPTWEVRKLLRAARSASLATVAEGQPFVSLVTPACAPDLALLMLLSDLSEHTRHLRVDPRCSVLICGEPVDANPQTTPRVTVTGMAEVVPHAALKARFLAVHPYAALYAGFTDFTLWRLRPMGGLFVGGFGRAARLRAADLTPDPQAVAAVAAAEAEIIAEWDVVAVDVDGCDVADGEVVRRVHWSAPVNDVEGLRQEIAAVAKPGTRAR